MVSTSIVDSIAAKAAALPMELQREVLHFIEFLASKVYYGVETQLTASGDQRKEPKARPPVKSILGSLEHLGIDITDEDIAEVRREMWANFPRELP